MQEPEPLISLGLNAGAGTAGSSSEPLPPAESLQFRKAEQTLDPMGGKRCASCKQTTTMQYFQANGVVVCEDCAAAIESGQKPAPAHLLLKSFFYGLGAAIGGSILYATVAIATGFEFALIAILIGYAVAKSIRHASRGGGRPQQFLAVALTYFSITTSYIPVWIYQADKQPPAALAPSSAHNPAPIASDASNSTRRPASSVGVVITLLGLALAAPFFAMQSAGGMLSLLIIFFGLRYAWRLTRRADVIVSGPYQTAASA
jgi:hypothetical protein